MTRPDVSLVMGVWQPHRDWLREAVRSALDQHGCKVELIVVDDGNPEPVAELLTAVSDPRLKLLRTSHAGPGNARNAGLEAATGSWIRFLDCDDVFDAESTARLLQLAAGDEGVIAYNATMVCTEDLDPVELLVSTVSGDAVRACLLGLFDVRLPSLLFSRPVVDAAGAWDDSFRVSGDWDFVLRALDHAVVRGDTAVATYYRRHAASVTRTAGVRDGELARRRIIDRYLERHPEARGSALVREAEAALLIDRGLAYAFVGETRRGLARFAQGARRDPSAAIRVLPRLLRAVRAGAR